MIEDFKGLPLIFFLGIDFDQPNAAHVFLNQFADVGEFFLHDLLLLPQAIARYQHHYKHHRIDCQCQQS